MLKDAPLLLFFVWVVPGGQIVPRVVLELRGGFRLSQADLHQMAELVVVEALQKG